MLTSCIDLPNKLSQLPQVLKDVTLFFSRSTPNLTMVILAMDYIDEMFTKGVLQKTKLDPAIRSAIGLAKKTLNRYYSFTDSSDLYRITMSKLQSFTYYFSIFPDHFF